MISVVFKLLGTWVSTSSFDWMYTKPLLYIYVLDKYSYLNEFIPALYLFNLRLSFYSRNKQKVSRI